MCTVMSTVACQANWRKVKALLPSKSATCAVLPPAGVGVGGGVVVGVGVGGGNGVLVGVGGTAVPVGVGVG